MNNLMVDVASSRTPRSFGIGRHLSRLRYQLLFGLLLTVLFPAFLYYLDDAPLALRLRNSVNTMIGGGIGFVISLYLYRRVATFPGVGLFGYVMPAVAAGYGTILAIFFAARIDYSRLTFGVSFAVALSFIFLASLYLRRYQRQRFYLIPSGNSAQLARLPGIEWRTLATPNLPSDPDAVLVVDLRADLGDEWERLVAQAALAGYPVYHSKQVQESLTGRVAIEHLSENSFGSLIPNLSYFKIKRLLDLVFALALLPLLIVPGVIVALLIKLETPGPAFFRQARRGYRGAVFQVLKFRTMAHRAGADAPGVERELAMTRSSDARITRLGRYLRRTRIDELPQIWNIILGQMSWIGPRPEALALSKWYMGELPFYTYRHIVRPGITGWAQVNQGHVAELEEVHEKLHYDFFYIKNFSAWLDVLILYRTVAIVFSGFGAK